MFGPGEEGNTILQNFGKYMNKDMTSHPAESASRGGVDAARF
jgi:hypothetical protein